MPGASPSGPLDASSTVRGLINTLAQTFAGVKTFLAAAVFSAGVQLGLLFNTNGSGSSDVVVKAGTSLADGSVNAAAKLWSLRSGLNGGTEVESVYMQKNAIVFARGTSSVIRWDNGGPNSWQIEATPGAGFLRMGNNLVQYFGLRLSDGYGVSSYGFEVNNTSFTQAYFRVGGLGASLGRIDQFGSDTTGTPGNATSNSAIGRSAIAGGNTTVTITNSLVAAGDHVDITWHGDLGTQSKIPWVSTAAGSFTVNVGTAPAGAVNFCWRVAKRL